MKTNSNRDEDKKYYFKDKNKMLYNNISLANADFIKELQDKLKKGTKRPKENT